MESQRHIDQFLAKFQFRPELQGYIGVEREYFLTESGVIVPRAHEFLELMHDPAWTNELSACQVESRTEPQKDILKIRLALLEEENLGIAVAERLGLDLTSQEVGNADMPLDVFPSERYQQIAARITREQLVAACRVAGTHIHIGVGNWHETFTVHNALRRHFNRFCRDGSSAERMRLYKIMAPQWNPPSYRDALHFFRTAQEQNFMDDPRRCYHLIRINPKGTVECRMFNATPHNEEIIMWVEKIQEIIKEEG